MMQCTVFRALQIASKHMQPVNMLTSMHGRAQSVTAAAHLSALASGKAGQVDLRLRDSLCSTMNI